MVDYTYKTINLSDRFLRFLLIFASSFIIIVIFRVILLSPPESYEISVYEAIPSVVWISLISSLLLILTVFASNPSRQLWIYSIILCGIISVLVIVLPYLRGYYLFFTGDSLYHIGVIRDLISQGQISERNIYPSLHLLTTGLVLVSDLRIESSVILILIFMTITSIMIGMIVARKLPLSNRGKILTMGLISIFSIGKIYYTFSPWAQSQSIFFYLILWFVFAGFLESHRYQFLVMMLLLSSVSFHIFTSMTLLVLFITAAFVKGSKEMIGKSISGTHRTAIILLVGAVSWLYWILSIERFTVVLRRSLISLFFPNAGPRQSQVSESAGIIFDASPDFLDIFSIFIFRYGKPTLIIGCAILLILFNSLSRKNTNSDYMSWIIFPLFLLWILGTMAALSPFPALTVGRLYHVCSSLAIIAIGYEIYYILDMKSRFTKTALVILIIMMLVISVPLTISTTYNSTGNKIPSNQILKSELTSTNWFIHNTETAVAYSTGSKIQRLGVYSQGAEGSVNTIRPPAHFNWSESDIESNSSSPQYLITTPRDRQINPVFYPNYEKNWDYTPDDFESMEKSKETEKVYSSEHVTIYRLHKDNIQ